MNLKEQYDHFQAILDDYYSNTITKLHETTERIKKLQEELAVIDKGDSSENAVLQICRDKIAMENVTLHDLTNQKEAIDAAREENYVHDQRVKIGSIVHLLLVYPESETEKDFVFKLVVPDLADFSELRLLAADSTVGKAILNHKQGDEINIISQSSKYTYKLQEVY